MNMISVREHSAPAYPLPLVNEPITIGGIASCAHQALLVELLLTPKPGLVDQRNCGAHRDMDLDTFLRSRRAIAPWWSRFVQLGCEFSHIPARDFLPLVRPAGMECEKDMLLATGGVNTHKGTIFSLGLLCAAAGRLLAEAMELDHERICAEVANMCTGLLERELSRTQPGHTAGERIFRDYGFTGARGEAASGYELVRTVALPVYEQLRLSGVSGDAVLLQVFLHLLAVNNDTNLVSRGDLAGLDYVRTHAANLLREGGALAPEGLQKMSDFDDELIARNLSPGGSADLLAITWFLGQFPNSEDIQTT